MNIESLTTELLRLSALLDDALGYLRRSVGEYAAAEAAYRQEKAKAWLTAPAGTVAEKEAHVNGSTAELRKQRDLADGMRQAALEAVRSRRAQLSALQSIAAAHREEAAFDRTGPR